MDFDNYQSDLIILIWRTIKRLNDVDLKNNETDLMIWV